VTSMLETLVTAVVARVRICTECRVVELEPAAIGDLCPGCAIDYQRHQDLQREMAEDADYFARESREHKAGCRFCAAWSGPAPLGGVRALCRKVNA
jgi:hypothetical protein